MWQTPAARVREGVHESANPVSNLFCSSAAFCGCWPNRYGGEFAAGIRHCVSLDHGIRARSRRENLMGGLACGHWPVLTRLVAKRPLKEPGVAFLTSKRGHENYCQ